MNGTGWPSHDEDEKARIVRCYTEADQPSGCLMSIVAILFLGFCLGIAVQKACDAGWRVQPPVTRASRGAS